MRNFKKIPIWENRRRVQLLNEFKTEVAEYSLNMSTKHTLESEAVPSYDENVENKIQTVRSSINKKSKEVNDIIIASNVSVFVHYTPSPAIGGMAINIDVIDNIFNLHNYDIELRHVIDITEQSIGVYERDKIRAWIRSFNPLFWFYEILDFTVSIPFEILRRVGFNERTIEKIENSFIVNIIKGFFYLIGVFAALLTILDKLGYLEYFKIILKLK